MMRQTLKATFAEDNDLFELFFIAETLGKTVDELLTGQMRPISDIERRLWVNYFNHKAEIAEKQRKKEEEKSSSGSNAFAPTPIDTNVGGHTMGRT